MIDSSKITTTSYQNPTHLSGLTAATCILKWLLKGYTKDQIVYSKFNGNRQLVSAWINFLKDSHWVEEEQQQNLAIDSNNLKVTKKGKIWLKRFESAAIRISNQ